MTQTAMSSLTRAPEDMSPLREAEIIWRDRYKMLKSHGYRLRQRYKPDWKPSWIGAKKPPQLHEDFHANSSARTIDAVRISDGRRVFLKRIRVYSAELEITRLLSEKERSNDPCNHSVPLLDEFVDDNDNSFVYMVLPLLRRFYSPAFYSVDEVLDFIRQLLEGIVYMHKLDIAHRDCSDLNIMMDADKLFPRGFHPRSLITDASAARRAYPKRRRDVSYVRYYFIDFGISTKFGPEGTYRKVIGTDGQDDEVPELSDDKSYDAFLVDVFILGNLFKKRFLEEKYTNLGFLEPLIDEMTQHNWMNRCTSTEALQIFNQIVSRQSWYTRRWRLKEDSTGRAAQLLQDVGTISRETMCLATSTIRASAHETAQFLRNRLQSRQSR